MINLIKNKFKFIIAVLFILGCKGNISDADRTVEDADTTIVISKQLIEIESSLPYATNQSYDFNNLIFLYNKFISKIDTCWYMTVVKFEDTFVKINLNVFYPYENVQYSITEPYSYSMYLYKGYASYMPEKMWNNIIQESCVKTILNKGYKLDKENESGKERYLLYFDSQAVFPTFDYPESYELFEQLRFEVVQRLYVMFKEREKNPKYKLETPDIWGRW